MLNKEYYEDRKADAIQEIEIRLLHGETLEQAKNNGPYMDLAINKQQQKEVDEYFERGAAYGKS